MPSYGQNQKPAGVDTTPPAKHLGTRAMDSRNRMIKTSLKIENCTYKGNAVLNANK